MLVCSAGSDAVSADRRGVDAVDLAAGSSIPSQLEPRGRQAGRRGVELSEIRRDGCSSPALGVPVAVVICKSQFGWDKEKVFCRN